MNNLCYIDTSKNTPSQEKGVEYIKKILFLYNENIDSVTVPKFFEILTNYKTKNDNLLTYGSIKYILSIMCKYRSDFKTHESYKTERFKLWNERNTITVEKYTKDEEQLIKNAIFYFINQFISDKNFTSNYYTGIAVLVALATNFRISEIKQITLNHLYKLQNDETINIKIKKKSKSMHIIVNKKLLNFLINKLESDNFGKFDYIVTISKTMINKNLKQYVQSNYQKNINIGIQSIRKINTTQLIENGSLELASVFNRHTSKQVTNQYYNTQNYVESFVNKIFKDTH